MHHIFGSHPMLVADWVLGFTKDINRNQLFPYAARMLTHYTENIFNENLNATPRI